MSISRIRAAVVAATLLMLIASPARAAAKTPTKEQVAQWIKELGADDFNVRESATKKLWEAGEAAEAAVIQAARSDDAEVARRAGELAEKFRWGIYPDTPAMVIDLVGRYRSADPKGKLAVVGEMFDAGAPGCATLLKIARAEKDASFRGQLIGLIGQQSYRAIPALLQDGSFTHLEALLELGIAADTEQAMTSYAAYWLLRGRIDEAVARWKAEADKPGNKRAYEVLAYLYRAKGELPAARVAAFKAGKADLIEQVLYDQGDWKALAERPAVSEYRRDIEALGFHAAYQRLAGEGEALNGTLAGLRKHAEGRPGNDVEVWYAAKALLLNDRPADALALLTKPLRHADLAFEILTVQGRYREAFALADALPADHPDKGIVEVLRARTLYLLGEKDKAQAVFTKVAGRIGKTPLSDWQERLIDVECRLGLREQAMQQCCRLLPGMAYGESRAPAVRLLGHLFPGHGAEADILLELLRGSSARTSDPATRMLQVGNLLAGRATEREIAVLGEVAGKKYGATVPEGPLLALATVALAAKQEALARGFLEKAAGQGSAAALLRLGDALAAKKEWRAAAGHYAEAWAKDTHDPLPLYLRGHALAQAGDAKEGALWTERARLLPLSNEEARSAFADALAERGRHEAARREREFLIRVSQPGSFYAGDALRQSALDAVARRDDARAADLHEKAMLRCLDARVSFQEGGAYVAVPETIHRHRALGLLAAGHLDEARKEIALCETILSGDVDLPCGAVPALDKLGRKKEADELFAHCRDLHEKLCQEYPKSAREHNSLAWLSACCRRELDKGLEHAQKAVALAPDSAGYYDTLGEVYFQRGDKEKALAAARKSVELAPKVVYYKRQLKRIEAGDPKAELPPQGDE
jgi:tetratricopeptide (TPR) repeat protein